MHPGKYVYELKLFICMDHWQIFYTGDKRPGFHPLLMSWVLLIPELQMSACFLCCFLKPSLSLFVCLFVCFSIHFLILYHEYVEIYIKLKEIYREKPLHSGFQ